MQPCEVCHLGMLQTKNATYTGWHHGSFVMLPNVDATLCDVCGDFTYDPATVTRIEMLLGSKRQFASQSSTLPSSGEAISHPIPRSRSI